MAVTVKETKITVTEDGKLACTLVSSDASADVKDGYTLNISDGNGVVATAKFNVKAPTPKPALETIADVVAGTEGPVSGANFVKGDYTGAVVDPKSEV